ncbi:hypothetical protein [Campylobacter sp. RM12647]|uniref:hypothetical protein n=1 Tax=Campylobacter sp. RM12647 TaxID=2735737 RepID=UPI001DEC3B6C|nr:hypothetical protein [Campylobacter sp. RM12647]
MVRFFNKVDFFIFVLSVIFYAYCIFVFKHLTTFSALDITANSIFIIFANTYYFYLYLKDELLYDLFFVFIGSSFILVNLLIYGCIIL